MVRRTSRPRLLPDDVELEEGWIRHDGSGCPIDQASRPGILFRAGTRFQPGKRRAEDWQRFSNGDCWSWEGRDPDGFDIVAYSPESEFVDIPRGGSAI